MKKLKVAILSGGPSAEHEVSLKSAENVVKNIDTSKFEIFEIKISKDGIWMNKNTGKKLPESDAIQHLKELDVDIVFIVLHGEYGEDGTLQKKLEDAGIKFTGSNSAASSLAMDKVKSSNILECGDLRIPSFIHLNLKDWTKNPNNFIENSIDCFGLPVVVKPTDRGSSVGTKIVTKKEDLEQAVENAFKFSENVMIQEYIKGRELTCAVIEGRNNEDIPLVPTEIIPNNADLFFDYDAKYKPGASLEITPPELPENMISEIQNQAIKAHAALGCTGLSRTDFILKDDVLYTLEVNTIPGMTETSLLPQGAKAMGIELSMLMEIIIESALRY